ncbi:MAG: hypothetical protein JAY60_20425 [Candidatus Thiodiazotropha weberae]|nr:hypothetical protein [Candidatus Thiodiazotropha weberae]
MLALSLFVAGVCCGYILTPRAENLDGQLVQVTQSETVPNGYHVELEQLSRQKVLLTRDECTAIVANSGKDEIQTQKDFSKESINTQNSYADLRDRIDLLPELLIEQQLEQLFDRVYLDSLVNPRGFAKELLDIAISDGDIRSLEAVIEDSIVVDIEFSLSPSSGLRHFSRLTEVERFDTIFTHFISSVDQSNLLVRWQHKETGEILYFSPLELTADQRAYISLTPQRGWQPGGYLISLYDLNNKQKLLSSNDYQIDAVIGGEESGRQVDQDVIEDLLSSGMAVPKAY